MNLFLDCTEQEPKSNIKLYVVHPSVLPQPLTLFRHAALRVGPLWWVTSRSIKVDSLSMIALPHPPKGGQLGFFYAFTASERVRC